MTLKELMDEAESLAGKLGIGSYALYERVGVNASTWMRWKRGERGPTYRKLQGLQTAVAAMRSELETKEASDGETG